MRNLEFRNIKNIKYLFMIDFKLTFAELIIRVFTGILFFFQGYDKLFNIKIGEVANTFMRDAERKSVPRSFVVFISYITSIIELVAGLFLILGLYTDLSTYALGIDLLMICFAFSFMNPMWDMKYVFPRLVLIIFLLLLPSETCKLSLDCLFHIK